MHGLMMDQPLLISDLIRHAERHHGATQIVSKTIEGGPRGSVHRYTYADAARRARRLANALATLASQLEPGNKHYRWLAGASWDRLLMRQLQPQWYGTQFKGDARGMYLYPVATDAVTDDERLRMVGHTLAESRGHVATAAAETGMPVRDPAPTIEDLRREAEQAEDR